MFNGVEKLQQMNRRQQIDPAAIACGYIAVGDKEQALA
jgi:hypothetical protein